MAVVSTIVSAERVRSGGVAGFFAKQKFELTVELMDESPVNGNGVASATVTAPAQGDADRPQVPVGRRLLMAVLISTARHPFRV